VRAPGPTRRDFLRGRNADPPLRPPWALAESEFTDRCTRCGECERACPQDIVRRGDGGFPEVDLRGGECTFCGRCADACEAGAFGSRAERPWQLRIAISDACFARRGVLCRSCGDACAHRAIAFRHAGSPIPAPIVDAQACTGCGACIGVCPADAITASPEVAA